MSGEESKGIGWRLRTAIESRGWETVLNFHETQNLEAAGVKYKTLNANIAENKTPRPQALRMIAGALGLDPSIFHLASDADFLRRLRDKDEEPGVTGGARVGIERNVPIVGNLTSDGIVRGHLAVSSIPLPVTAGLLERQHAKRRTPDDAIEHRSIEGIPIDAEVVLAEEAVELRDETPQVIGRGDYLVVTRERPPEPRKLVLARKIVDDFRSVPARGNDSLKPELRLFRYLQDGKRWSLGAIDGSDVTHGSGDGWTIVAAVLWWRSP